MWITRDSGNFETVEPPPSPHSDDPLVQEIRTLTIKAEFSKISRFSYAVIVCRYFLLLFSYCERLETKGNPTQCTTQRTNATSFAMHFLQNGFSKAKKQLSGCQFDEVSQRA